MRCNMGRARGKTPQVRSYHTSLLVLACGGQYTIKLIDLNLTCPLLGLPALLLHQSIEALEGWGTLEEATAHPKEPRKAASLHTMPRQPRPVEEDHLDDVNC